MTVLEAGGEVVVVDLQASWPLPGPSRGRQRGRGEEEETAGQPDLGGQHLATADLLVRTRTRDMACLTSSQALAEEEAMMTGRTGNRRAPVRVVTEVASAVGTTPGGFSLRLLWLAILRGGRDQSLHALLPRLPRHCVNAIL